MSHAREIGFEQPQIHVTHDAADASNKWKASVDANTNKYKY
jgi:hypothetical protein